MATNQIQRFEQNSYVWLRITQGTFLKNFCQNICSDRNKGLLSLFPL